MKRVTIRVPATTANLGPGFDAFGCALSLYTDVTFEETEYGLEITGCPEEFAGPDNLAYVSYCAVMATMCEEVRGVKIHIDAQIPVCRGLGSSAALLVAGAMGANILHGSKLSTQGLLNITNAMEGHPDNLAPAFYGGLTASMVDNGLPVCVNFPLHPDWEFLALIPEFFKDIFSGEEQFFEVRVQNELPSHNINILTVRNAPGSALKDAFIDRLRQYIHSRTNLFAETTQEGGVEEQLQKPIE